MERARKTWRLSWILNWHHIGQKKEIQSVVTVIRPYIQYPRDPKDEPVLNLAIQEQVNFLVTRDNDLLDLNSSHDFRLLYPYMKVVNPLEFVRNILHA